MSKKVNKVKKLKSKNKSKLKKDNKEANKEVNKNIKSNDYELNLTDKSFLDFKKSKSISISTKLSDIKESKIGELYDTKIFYNKINNLCIKKVSNKGLPLTKKVSTNICSCLFDKNKNLSVSELEKKVLSKTETPGSQCVKILDKFLQKNKIKSESGRSSRYSRYSKSLKSAKFSKSARYSKHT